MQLEYPRSGTPAITTMKMMDLPSRRRVELDTSDFWESGLFKELIDTETRLTVTISDRDAVSRFGKWIRRILSLMFKASISPKVSGTTNIFQGAVASDLQTKLIAGVAGSDADAMVTELCASRPIHLEIHSNGVSAYIKKGGSRVSVLTGNELSVDLFASATFNQVVGHETNPGTNIRRAVKETRFRKGDKLGIAKIVIVGA